MSNVKFNLEPVNKPRKSTSDVIRNFINHNYIQPARRKGLERIEIISGDIHKQMKLRSQVPSVCSVLEGKKLQNAYDVELIEIIRKDGVKNYSTTNRYVFRILGTEINKVGDVNTKHISSEVPYEALSGITEEVSKELMRLKTLDLDSCKKLGFGIVGSFTTKNDLVEMNLIDLANDNGVYLFVVNEEVMYVGMTQNGINSRMYQYKSPGRRQETNKRINELIQTTLTLTKAVDIFFLSDSQISALDVRINDLMVTSDEKLLERYLISGLIPKWNRG